MPASSDPWLIQLPRLYQALGERVKRYPSELSAEIQACQEPYPLDLSLVTSESPVRYKRAVENISYYFRRETGFSFAGYEVESCGRHRSDRTRAFLFTNGDPERPRAIGAGCFRLRAVTEDTSLWGLQWIWLHPFARGKTGISRERLRRAWPFFEAFFGPFGVESPLSGAMKRFLESQQAVPTALADGKSVDLYGAGSLV